MARQSLLHGLLLRTLGSEHIFLPALLHLHLALRVRTLPQPHAVLGMVEQSPRADCRR